MKLINRWPPITAVLVLALSAACTSLPALPATPEPATTTPTQTLGVSETPRVLTPQPTASPKAAIVAAIPPLLTGVNLAGADFGRVDRLPGVYGVDYFYPTHAEVDYFLSKGMTVFRLPFSWENLQHSQFADFDPAELARLDDIVGYATGRGARVILDPHNYARYYNKIVGGPDVPASALTDLWTRLATHFKDDSRLIFGLMNEPNTMPTELWLADANAAIQAIRQTGAANLILVPGNAWSGAASWDQSWYGTPNAKAMLGVVDPGHNYAYEVHQYLDQDSSGTHEECVSRTIGSERLASLTAWLRQHAQRAFLGEFAGARNDTCYAALDDMLDFVDHNAGVWLGWTYWAAGPKWGEYRFTLEPAGGADRPQMAVLLRHIRLLP
jgi:endoglucanase